MNKRKLISLILSLTLTVGILSGCGSGTNSSTSKSDSVEITNVSYDPTRELYEEYNDVFADYWKAGTFSN